MYEFAWRSPAFDGRLGACHALEIPFVFDTLAIEGMEVLLGEAAPQALADAMHTAWVGFITRGDPGWPQYDLDQRQTMHFDASSELLKDPRSAERALWEGLRQAPIRLSKRDQAPKPRSEEPDGGQPHKRSRKVTKKGDGAVCRATARVARTRTRSRSTPWRLLVRATLAVALGASSRDIHSTLIHTLRYRLWGPGPHPY